MGSKLPNECSKNLTGLQDPEASLSLLSVIRKLQGIPPKESQVRILTEGTYRGKRRSGGSGGFGGLQGSYDGGGRDGDGYLRDGAAAEIKQEGLEFRV
ncbi:hypothetical protein GOBAR_AA22851 [Gossypium barbadense]|uniref:Uncharacterized protein n=1 Tax=Gossypium barbadense TaxID=3634 RepID=A0A2P5X3C0_GOSBA|nr:hypothetical protein GOBAR_AA22851 [Gossypium barbadense]